MRMQKAVVTQQNKILDILHSTKSLSMSPNVPHKIQIKAIKSADRIKLSTQNSIILSFFINLIFFAKIHFLEKVVSCLLLFLYPWLSKSVMGRTSNCHARRRDYKKQRLDFSPRKGNRMWN